MNEKFKLLLGLITIVFLFSIVERLDETCVVCEPMSENYKVLNSENGIFVKE